MSAPVATIVRTDTDPLHFSPRPAHPGAMPDRHPLTRAAFIEDLQELAPTDWPTIWGSAYAPTSRHALTPRTPSWSACWLSRRCIGCG